MFHVERNLNKVLKVSYANFLPNLTTTFLIYGVIREANRTIAVKDFRKRKVRSH